MNKATKKQRQLEATKRWQARNPEKVKAYRDEHGKEQWKKHYAKNKEGVLIKNAGYVEEVRKKAIKTYGGKCLVCKIKDIDFLAIDHINNDGHKTKTRSYGYWKRLVLENNPLKYQVLCHNHNWKKYLTNLRSKKYGTRKNKT